jgi:uncharacterized protein YxjI
MSANPVYGNQPPAQPQPQVNPLWYQNHYIIKKKALRVVDQYYIEDPRGARLAYSKQKFWKIKEDIRIYTDESMAHELFRVKQAQIIDAWGKFDVIDSATNTHLGYFRRKALMSGFVYDEWEIYNPYNQMIGRLEEEAGRGIARKYLPGGALIPEKMTMKLNGVPVVQINQRFKIVGDIWDIQCHSLPPQFDRRVLLAGVILMAMIERQRK